MQTRSEARSEKKAIFFCNGLRRRIINESGGYAELASAFHYFADIAPLMKPWETKITHDRVSIGKTLKTLGEVFNFLKQNEIDYVLFVGFIGSRRQLKVIACLRWLRIRWGVLEIRKDYIKRFTERNPLEKRLKAAAKRLIFFPNHIITNERFAQESFNPFCSQRVFFVNHRDFYALSENILESEGRQISDARFLVFLDQALPFHYGGNLRSGNCFYDKEKSDVYLNLVFSYLKSLEVKTGLSAVFALHPNAPEWYENKIKSRFLVSRITAKASLSARLFITHCSNSTSYSYFLGKPMILLDLQEYLPRKVKEQIYIKHEVEGFPVQVWKQGFEVDEIVLPEKQSPKNEEIKFWLMPLQSSKSLVKEIEDIIKNKRYGAPRAE